jgi:hypothetical protein
MNRLRNIFFLTVCLLVASRFMAQAEEPILLGESVSIFVGGTWTGAPVPPTITGMQFFIADQPPFVTVSYAGGTYLQADDTQLTNAVGENLFLAKGQTGIFDFAATNSPGFTHIVAQLTNGTNDQSSVGGFGYNPDRIVTGGTSYSGQESGLWNLQLGQDLAGCTVNFFRLIVTQVDWGQTNGGFQISGVAQWQIYGFPPPISPSPRLQLYRTPLEAILVSWPTQAVGFVLQCGSDPQLEMTNVPTAPVIIGANNVVLLPTDQPKAFYRLLYAP